MMTSSIFQILNFAIYLLSFCEATVKVSLITLNLLQFALYFLHLFGVNIVFPTSVWSEASEKSKYFIDFRHMSKCK